MDGMPAVLPIQGAIVATVFLVIAVKVFGVRGTVFIPERRRRHHASVLVHLDGTDRIRGSRSRSSRSWISDLLIRVLIRRGHAHHVL